MNRRYVIGRRGSGVVAHFFGVGGPGNRKGLGAPYSFKQRPIGSPGSPVNGAGKIGQSHFDRVGWRPFGLLSRWISEAAAGRAHIPEIATDHIALPFVVMKYWR